MINKNIRARANLAMLEFVAIKLKTLIDEFVFVGGSTTALFINDPSAPDIRTTLDVDSIVDVLSLGDYYKLEKKLAQHGFKKSMQDTVICRWHYDDIVFDVMPTDAKILGFGNPWYKEAIKQPVTHQLTDDLKIKSVTAPYFLATKLEAFKDRGNNDFFASHDFEDIISVIDGRIEIVEEIKSSSKILNKFIENEFLRILTEKNFHASLPGHLNYGASTPLRTTKVLNRIKELANMPIE